MKNRFILPFVFVLCSCSPGKVDEKIPESNDSDKIVEVALNELIIAQNLHNRDLVIALNDQQLIEFSILYVNEQIKSDSSTSARLIHGLASLAKEQNVISESLIDSLNLTVVNTSSLFDDTDVVLKISSVFQFTEVPMASVYMSVECKNGCAPNGSIYFLYKEADLWKIYDELLVWDGEPSGIGYSI